MTSEDYHDKELCSYYICTYSYDNIEHGYYTVHEYRTGNKCWGKFAEISECDYDITIEEDGMITYGERYNMSWSE